MKTLLILILAFFIIGCEEPTKNEIEFDIWEYYSPNKTTDTTYDMFTYSNGTLSGSYYNYINIHSEYTDTKSIVSTEYAVISVYEKKDDEVLINNVPYARYVKKGDSTRDNCIVQENSTVEVLKISCEDTSIIIHYERFNGLLEKTTETEFETIVIKRYDD